MAIIFSEIEILGKTKVSPKILVGGTPKCEKDLAGWIEAERHLAEQEGECAVIVKVYRDGEGKEYPADGYYVAHFLSKIERFKEMGKDWMSSIPTLLTTYSFSAKKPINKKEDINVLQILQN